MFVNAPECNVTHGFGSRLSQQLTTGQLREKLKQRHAVASAGVQSSTYSGGRARAEWDREMAAELEAGKTRPQAVKSICKRRPELRDRLEAEANNR